MSATAAVSHSPLAAAPLGDAEFAQRVIAWQRRQGRHGLPWQGTRDPYRVWLSEIMLQQTQVSTVLAYYARFLERFPTVHALAAAPEDAVLAAWSGLGYYSRARNLHRCAQAVVSNHAGRFPASAAGLEALPGIGRSTAAAIAAFCFGERAAILDGNVKRVLARVLAFDGDLAQSGPLQRLWAHAEALLPTSHIEVYTQGLMDLGAQICTVRRPQCDACPLRTGCRAHEAGRPTDFPIKVRRVRRSHRASVLLCLRHRDRLWLVRRPDRGVWASLWCFPEWPLEPGAATLEGLEGWPGQGQEGPAFVHALTHVDWQLHPVHWTLPTRMTPARATDRAQGFGNGQWMDVPQALACGVPAPVRRWLQALA